VRRKTADGRQQTAAEQNAVPSPSGRSFQTRVRVRAVSPLATPISSLLTPQKKNEFMLPSNKDE